MAFSRYAKFLCFLFITVLFYITDIAAALRQSNWKIVRVNTNVPWELYDLGNDRSETQNLAAAYPERVDVMNKRWKELANPYSIFPKP